MYTIEFTPEAHDDLYTLRKTDQVRVVSETESQLTYEPQFETKHRKKLRPNEIAVWELRIGKFRVFYNVEEESQLVIIEAIGFKIGNVLFIRGAEKTL